MQHLYQAPLNDFDDILDMLSYAHDEFDRELVKDLLRQVADTVEKELVATNAVGDQQGLVYHAADGRVLVPELHREVYRLMNEQGLFQLPLQKKWGGQEAPMVIHNMVTEMLSSGNLALSTCAMLTHGAIGAIEGAADDDLKERFLPKMAQGEWSGTMCLTEPQCGTDLGLIRTKAVKENDHYLISGQKIWITFGEHELSENIIHLVLARCEGAPEGIKGISMFIVPKILENGQRNHVKCMGLEEKMGQHASPTCVMKFDRAIGYLVGEQHKGMRAMFAMMNPARIAVGIQGLASAELAYQIAKSFTQQRRQSRSLIKHHQQLDHEADLIWAHPDVRRMLLHIRSGNAGMRMFVGQVSSWIDQGEQDLVALCTPVIKSFTTDCSLNHIVTAQQICGGAGYTKDFGIEQILRDARITTIYEGTNGIQALDLLGRKIAKDGGRSLMKLMAWIKDSTVHAGEDITKGMYRHIAMWEKANKYMLTHMSDMALMGFIASDYLRIVGHMCVMASYCHMLKVHESYEPLLHFYMNYVAAENEMHVSRICQSSLRVMDDWNGCL